MDLLGHSAGAFLAIFYAVAHPERVSRLLLITPGLPHVEDTEEGKKESAALMASRAGQPWYPAAQAARAAIESGSRSLDDFRAARPFYYARWDSTAEQHCALGVADRHQPARAGFFHGFEEAVPATAAALANLAAPVLLYAGDQDPLVTPAMVRDAAPTFRAATVTVQPACGHFPWIDGPAAFTTAIEAFLG
jgi:proline iminopeptidase